VRLQLTKGELPTGADKKTATDRKFHSNFGLDLLGDAADTGRSDASLHLFEAMVLPCNVVRARDRSSATTRQQQSTCSDWVTSPQDIPILG
jgi:hypothetical protein